MRTYDFRRSDIQTPCHILHFQPLSDLSDLFPAPFTRMNIFFFEDEVHRIPVAARSLPV
jgi:hypothetical protein